MSDRNLQVARLVNSGALRELPDREAVLGLVRPGINQALAQEGLQPAFEENWIVVQKDGHVIVSGSTMRSRSEIVAFMFVISRGREVYSEIGRKEFGRFPTTLDLD
ncbi:MAG: hypothetical protein AB1941_19120 [Gemmatimonadota bacterium]